jgi:beta-aspartyl-peptidase (threonine type)
VPEMDATIMDGRTLQAGSVAARLVMEKPPHVLLVADGAGECAKWQGIELVAMDQAGNSPAGTSTGGTMLRMPGRVSDSPIIGAGTYASYDSCAVSATGTGEYFMRNVVATDICARVRYLHIMLDQAANEVVMKELVEQYGNGQIKISGIPAK